MVCADATNRLAAPCKAGEIVEAYATGEDYVRDVPQPSIDLDWSSPLSYSQTNQLRLIEGIVIENLYALGNKRRQ